MKDNLHKRANSSTRVGSTVEMAAMHNEDEDERTPFQSPSADNFAYDDGPASDDEDDRALLGTERQARGRDLSDKNVASTWTQVKDIVIEVRGIVVPIEHCDCNSYLQIDNTDCTHAAPYNCWAAFHWRAFRPCFGRSLFFICLFLILIMICRPALEGHEANR